MSSRQSLGVCNISLERVVARGSVVAERIENLAGAMTDALSPAPDVPLITRPNVDVTLGPTLEQTKENAITLAALINAACCTAIALSRVSESEMMHRIRTQTAIAHSTSRGTTTAKSSDAARPHCTRALVRSRLRPLGPACCAAGCARHRSHVGPPRWSHTPRRGSQTPA